MFNRGTKMSPFIDKTREFIYHYKQILKRYLPLKHYNEKIKSLEIKRKDLKGSTDVHLFHTIHRILADVKIWYTTHHMPASEFSGIQAFHDHMNGFIEQYSLEQNKIVNHNHRATKATIDAIQLLSQPLTHTILEKLKHHINTLRHFGTSEQINTLRKALSRKANSAEEALPLIAQLS